MQLPKVKLPKLSPSHSHDGESGASRRSSSDVLRGLLHPRSLVIGLVVGLVLGGVLMWAKESYNPPDVTEDAQVVAVFGRMQDQNELVSVSYNYTIVDKASDKNRLFDLVDVPFSENSFWYRYAGEINAGVSLETADIDVHDGVIIVTLEEPYFISNTPDMETTGVLEERNNILNPIHVEDVDEMQAQCVQASEEQALAAGVLDEARSRAEENIRTVFFSVFDDDYVIEFAWPDRPAEGE